MKFSGTTIENVDYFGCFSSCSSSYQLLPYQLILKLLFIQLNTRKGMPKFAQLRKKKLPWKQLIPQNLKYDNLLLQSATAILLQSVTSVITKCDRYYKVWRLLQSATEQTLQHRVSKPQSFIHVTHLMWEIPCGIMNKRSLERCGRLPEVVVEESSAVMRRKTINSSIRTQCHLF